MARTPPRVVLFDLGGVLVQVPGVAGLQELARIDGEAQVWRRWLECEWVRRFERGYCSPDEFAAGVVADWHLPITGDEFLDRFRRWPNGLFEGARDLLEAARRQVAVGCLSNTNRLHWNVMQEWGLGGMFDHTFLSYEMGLVKPDREVFQHVAAHLDVPVEDVLFLDDNAVNVEEAAAFGFDTERVRGTEGACRALRSRGLHLCRGRVGDDGGHSGSGPG